MDVTPSYSIVVLLLGIGLTGVAGWRYARSRSQWSLILLIGVVAWFAATFAGLWVVRDVVFYVGLIVAIAWALSPPRGRRMLLIAAFLWIAHTLLMAPVGFYVTMESGSSRVRPGGFVVPALLLAAVVIGAVNKTHRPNPSPTPTG